MSQKQCTPGQAVSLDILARSGAFILALLFCRGAWATDQTFRIECTGGPEAGTVYQYNVDSYKRSVHMATVVGTKTIADPVFLLDGKGYTMVRFIDDKIILAYTNDAQNTYTVVLPVNGGTGNMKIGNIAGEKDHPDGYSMSCARK
jgi:hypothetical protein